VAGGSAGERLDRPPGAVRAILANRALVRVELAWALGVGGDAALTVALLVAAFGIGGPVAIGVLTIVRMAPSVVGAPLAGLLARRRQPEAMLFVAHGIRALGALAVTVSLAVHGPVLIGLAAATIAASAGAFVRPLQVSATPGFASTPAELVAANGATSTGEGIGAFVGPLAGGLLLLAGGPVAAAAAATVLFGLAAAALARLAPNPDEAARRRAEETAGRAPAPVSLGLIGRELTAGLRTLRCRPGPATVMIGFGGQVIVRGMMTTLIVVASVDLLGLGEAGVGALGAASGFGALVGALLAVRLAGSGRLAPSFAVSLSLWGLPLAIIAAVPQPAVAFVALAVSGIANATLDVAGFTLLQRGVSGSERMAVFGVLESMASLLVAVGGAVAPVLVHAVGDRGALALAGGLLPILAVASWPRLHLVDDEAVLPERQLGLLRSVRLFSRLPLTALERLAESMVPIDVPTGMILVREGEPGEDYYVIESGRFEVRHGPRVVSEVGPGDGVGEIALLRSVPRTATVVALEPGAVHRLDRAAFLMAVAGPTSAAAAAETVDLRLARSAAG